MNQPLSIRKFIDELVRETGLESPEAAIRFRAKELLQLYTEFFGEPEMPIDVMELASLRSIHPSDDLPVQSPDAELVPRQDGGVEMRVHPDRPETRKRFSIAHEICHTFFPDYEQSEWCRTDAHYRNRTDPAQYLEMLCDIGAAELLFPQPWFSEDASRIGCASDLKDLAIKYHGSREATLRRHVELSSDSVVAVYFTWKLKPAQKGVVDNQDQGNLFGITPEDQIRDALALRIDYSIPSASFKSLGHYLPPDKSIENSGPIFMASSTGKCFDGEHQLGLGAASGTYSIMAIPLPTPLDQRGPNGEHNVAGILKPIAVQRSTKKRTVEAENAPSLFD